MSKKGDTNKTPRENSGRRGSRKNPQSLLNLILLGKGPYKQIKPITTAPWRGSEGSRDLFDAEQSKKNKKMGYW